MTSDEKLVIEYLQNWPQSFISYREIARKAASKQRFVDDPSWPLPILTELLAIGLVEKDSMGYFRVISTEVFKHKNGHRVKRHLSPQILRILTKSGRDFNGVVIDINTDNLSDGIPAYPKPVQPVQNPFLKSDKDNKDSKDKDKDKGKDKSA